MATFYGKPVPEGLENMGKPWKELEISQLLNEIKEKKQIHEIAKLHKRTAGGITSRLREIAAEYFIKDSIPVSEIMLLTGLDKDDIIDAISKREYKDELRAKNIEAKKKAKLEHSKTIEEYVLSPSVPKKSESSELKEILSILKNVEKRISEYIKEKSIFDE